MTGRGRLFVVLALGFCAPLLGESHRAPILTATAAGAVVRFAGFGEVREMRLDVFDDEGRQIYDGHARRGNLFDYAMDDRGGRKLSDGAYLFVVTIVDLDGASTQKFGVLRVSGQHVILESSPAEGLPPRQIQALMIHRIAGSISPVDRIGADVPVAIAAADAPSGAGPIPAFPRADVAGTGTTNKVTKWTDASGTLGDSAITEVGGKVGIGTTTPLSLFHVFGPATADVFSGLGPDPVAGPAMNYGYAGNSFGRGAGFFNVRPDGSALPPNPSLRFMTNNVQRMIITNAGNIGIATLAPAEKLDVAGNLKLSAAGQLIFPDNSFMTKAGATLDGNTFNGDQNVTGNVSATGTVSGNIVNATTQFNLDGQRVLRSTFLDGSLAVGLGTGTNTPAFSTFIGMNAGASVTTGPYNLFVGGGAGAGTTTGQANTCAGSLACQGNVTGSNNAYFGAGAGQYMTGSNNSIFGFTGSTLIFSAASFNSLFGTEAGVAVTSGSNNTFMGYRAGYNVTTGSNNAVVGNNAAASMTTENNNTFLGNLADGSAGIANATAVGNRARATQSNTVILGSINGVNGSVIDAKVGIGTTTPEAMLSVGDGINLDQKDLNGDFNALTGPALTFGSGTGEGIASKRTALGGNQFGLNFYTQFTRRLTIDNLGNVQVVGTLTKGGGSFKIDHPLDPANKYLSHSFVESPDMMNVYNGNVSLDDQGEAIVELPEWFEALNRDFRYQLTAMGTPSPSLYVAGEIEHNRFRIGGGTPGARVSWQVTGIRHDAYANAHRIPVDEEKPPEERGRYLHPLEIEQARSNR